MTFSNNQIIFKDFCFVTTMIIYINNFYLKIKATLINIKVLI